MIKKLLLIAGICTSQIVNAQQMPLIAQKGAVLADRSFEDCKGNIYSVNDLLAEGKPLIIFQSTVDCGYCVDEAPEVSDDILKYKDRINFVFMLSPHHTYPRCSGEDAGEYDWPGDWQNKFPGYREIPCAIQPSGDDYFLLLCEVTTSFGLIDPITKKIVDGGCREGGRENAIKAALKMYADGKIARKDKTVSKPTIAVTGTGSTRSISISCATPNATIYYSIDGCTPTNSSSKYTGTFNIGNTALVKAVAYQKDMNSSPVKAIMVEFTSDKLVNVARSGTGYEWTGLTDIKSNSNRKSQTGVNDGKMEDVRVNGGNEDNQLAYQAMGVVWNEVKKDITSIKLTHHTGLAEGWGSRDFFGHDMRLQSTQDGSTWTDLETFGHYPEYPYGGEQKFSNIPYPTYFFTDTPLTAKGIRVAGRVHIVGTNWSGMTAKQVGLKELEIFNGNTITANDVFDTNQGYQIYPNPAKNIINVQIAENNATEIEIMDVTGKKLIVKKVTKSIENIDVSNLSKGLYILNIKGSNSLRRNIVIE